MKYEGFAVKSIGQSHIDSNKVCQDSAQYIQDTSVVVAAVADGHGGSNYFRSDKGSSFAANIACEKLFEFLHDEGFDPSSDENIIKKYIDQLISSIVTEWKINVREHLLKTPFTEEEMLLVNPRYINDYTPFSEKKVCEYTEYELKKLLQPDNEKILKAYGSTLICIGSNDLFTIGLHIGDGKCVALYDDGSSDEPIEWDPKCHLNVCTSICDPDSTREFRYKIWLDKRPAAIFIGSDGIDDTFAAMLHQFYRNTALNFVKGDFRTQVIELNKALPEISRRGSQDDVSIAGIIDLFKIREIKDLINDIGEKEQKKTLLANEQQKLTELEFRLGKAERILSASQDDPDKYSVYEQKAANLRTDIAKTKAAITKLKNELCCTSSEIKKEKNSEISSEIQNIVSESDSDDEDWD